MQLLSLVHLLSQSCMCCTNIKRGAACFRADLPCSSAVHTDQAPLQRSTAAQNPTAGLIEDEDCLPLTMLSASRLRSANGITQTCASSCTSHGLASEPDMEPDHDDIPVGHLIAAKHGYGRASICVTATYDNSLSTQLNR